MSIARHSDPEGLYNIFKTRIKGSILPHENNFPKDRIINEFDPMIQEWRKEKWIIFRKLGATI